MLCQLSIMTDPVGYYFNEKLQSLFACQRALKSIRKTNQDQPPSMPTHTQSLIVQETNIIQNSQESAKSKQTICVEQKKKERQTKAKIAMEIQDKIEVSQNDLQHLISGYQKASDQTQKVIEEDLKRQDDLFMQRRLKRESIIPYLYNQLEVNYYLFFFNIIFQMFHKIITQISLKLEYILIQKQQLENEKNLKSFYKQSVKETNLMRKSSRMCSTKCSTERLDLFESCIEFSSGGVDSNQDLNNARLMLLLKEQSGKISSEKTNPIAPEQADEVQPFEEIQIEEMDEIDNIIPPRRQIRESSSEDVTDTPPQPRRKIKQFGMMDNNGDLLLIEDEQNLISDLNIELN